jgi:hypothetical protein
MTANEPAPVRVPASPEHPVYRKVAQNDSGATTRFMIICDEGWRTLIVCEDMYIWGADWLLGILGRQPYGTPQ